MKVETGASFILLLPTYFKPLRLNLELLFFFFFKANSNVTLLLNLHFLLLQLIIYLSKIISTLCSIIGCLKGVLEYELSTYVFYKPPLVQRVCFRCTPDVAHPPQKEAIWRGCLPPARPSSSSLATAHGGLQRFPFLPGYVYLHWASCG